MQNPKEDTQWNDILRSKGILPPKEKEVTENHVITLVEKTIQEKQEKVCKSLDKLSLDELDELEDEKDERVLLEYRKKRISELKAQAEKAKFGEVKEISAQDYTNEVNKAGRGVWVVLFLYKEGIPQCALINEHLSKLAVKFPSTKFLKSISSTCIPNYPDRNLPTIFVYFEGNFKRQIVGPYEFRGMNLTCDGKFLGNNFNKLKEKKMYQQTRFVLNGAVDCRKISLFKLEYMLGRTGAIKAEVKQDPKPMVHDVMFSNLLSPDFNDDFE